MSYIIINFVYDFDWEVAIFRLTAPVSGNYRSALSALSAAVLATGIIFTVAAESWAQAKRGGTLRVAMNRNFNGLDAAANPNVFPTKLNVMRAIFEDLCEGPEDIGLQNESPARNVARHVAIVEFFQGDTS